MSHLELEPFIEVIKTFMRFLKAYPKFSEEDPTQAEHLSLPLRMFHGNFGLDDWFREEEDEENQEVQQGVKRQRGEDDDEEDSGRRAKVKIEPEASSTGAKGDQSFYDTFLPLAKSMEAFTNKNKPRTAEGAKKGFTLWIDMNKQIIDHFKTMSVVAIVAMLKHVQALHPTLVDAWPDDADGDFLFSSDMAALREKGIDGHLISMINRKLFDAYGIELPSSGVAVEKEDLETETVRDLLTKYSFLPERSIDTFKDMDKDTFRARLTKKDAKISPYLSYLRSCFLNL